MSEEVMQSKKLLMRISQEQGCPEVITAINRGTQLPKGYILNKYDIFKDNDGLVWVQGRVRSPQDRLQPMRRILLSLTSPLTKLIIQTEHQQGHLGVSAMMATMNENYFVTGLRSYLKKISRNCAVCQKAYARTVNQKMGLLPVERTTPSSPFLHTGMDFAGPFRIR